MTFHIFFKKNPQNEVSKNKVEDKVFRDVRIDLIDYEKDWVKEVDSKGRIWVIPSIFSLIKLFVMRLDTIFIG